MLIKRIILLSTLLLSMFSQLANAATLQGGSVNLKRLGQYLLIPITYKTQGFEKDSHAVVDLANPDYLSIHKAVYDSIGGTLASNRLSLVNDTFQLDVDFSNRKQVKRLEAYSTYLEDINAQYDIELNNVDVTAIIGVELLRKFNVKISIEQQQFALRSSTSSLKEQLMADSDAFITGLTVEKGKTLIPVYLDSASVGRMQINTVGYHTSVKAEDEQFKLIEDDLKLRQDVGYYKLAGRVAFQQTKPKSNDDAPLIISGLGLWQIYNLTLDISKGYMALEQLTANNYQVSDKAFYDAFRIGKWQSLNEFINKYPLNMHVQEAVELMYQRVALENILVAGQLAALNLAAEQMRLRARSSYFFRYCRLADFSSKNQIDFVSHAIAYCKRGLDFISYSQSPGDRQYMQLILGKHYLDAGDAKTGWKYYLSASFNGDPRLDSQTKLGLASAYEAMHRYKRALSTYQRLAKQMSKEQRDVLQVDKAIKRLEKKLESQSKAQGEEL